MAGLLTWFALAGGDAGGQAEAGGAGSADQAAGAPAVCLLDPS